MKNKGFSTTELLVSVAVVGILGALGFGVYETYTPKAQSAEVGQMMNRQMLELSKSIKNGVCTPNTQPLSIQGKYGTLSVSGTPVKSLGASCASGCEMQYSFNSSGVHRQVKGKVFKVDVLNNSKLSKADSSTLAEKYWPAGITKLSPVAGDVCTALVATTPTPTTGNVSGTEVGGSAPPSPSPSPGTGSGSGSQPDPNAPTQPPQPPPGGTGTGDQTPVDDGTIHINSAYAGTNSRDSGYYIKNTVNVYDAVVSNLKITPNSTSKVKIIVYPDVAVVGNATSIGAFVFDSRIPAGMEVSIENNGYILGRGGQGNSAKKPPSRCLYDEWGDVTSCIDDWYFLGENGGHAIHGGYANVKITNRGIIAGGGAGGWGMYDFDHGQDGGGGWREYGYGGAPFGLGGGYGSRPASLLKASTFNGDNGGFGGNIGMDASAVPRYARQNRGAFAIAGCPYTGTNVKINNAGSGRVMGNSGCQPIRGF